MLSIKIGNRINLDLVPLQRVQLNTFVKLVGKEHWYFIGNDNELDALPIRETNIKYSLFIDKNLGDKIVFENRYGTDNREEEIENIFSIEKYVLWQTIYNFQKLSKDGDLEGVEIVEIPQKEDSIDPQNLINFLDDSQKKTNPFFE